MAARTKTNGTTQTLMTNPAPSLSKEDEGRRDALVGRLFGAGLQALELFAVYLGNRLGYYSALASGGPLTSKDLARHTKTHERYAREWLEQQAVAGLLEVDKVSADPAARRYRLPAGHAEVLLNQESPAYLAPLSRYPVAVGQQIEKILDAYRTGGGVSWTAYGPDMWQAQAQQNRPFFFEAFTQQYLPAIPEIDARLRADPSARVADIACGAGWSSIAMAQAYPKARVDGFDLDREAIRLGTKNARDYGVSDRVRLHARDAADPGVDYKFDLVTIVEAVHDMSQPVQVLKAARKLLAPGGSVLVVDENVAEEFTAPGTDTERFFYGASLVACLPNGMADKPSAATGTVMRPKTLGRYATEAGFRRFEVLPLQHDFFRFYRLSG